jgi:hypothetical protein
LYRFYIGFVKDNFAGVTRPTSGVAARCNESGQIWENIHAVEKAEYASISFLQHY